MKLQTKEVVNSDHVEKNGYGETDRRKTIKASEKSKAKCRKKEAKTKRQRKSANVGDLNGDSGLAMDLSVAAKSQVYSVCPPRIRICEKS